MITFLLVQNVNVVFMEFVSVSKSKVWCFCTDKCGFERDYYTQSFNSDLCFSFIDM